MAPFWRFFSEALNYGAVKVLLLLLIVGMVWRGGRARTTIVQALIAVGIANPLTDLLKRVSPQPRPYQELHMAITRAGMNASHGTASAHSANMAAVAVIFTLGLRLWGIPWILVAVLTGISRIYVGVHYPSQVLLGWLCGLFAGITVFMTWKLVERSRGTGQTMELDEQN